MRCARAAGHVLALAQFPPVAASRPRSTTFTGLLPLEVRHERAAIRIQGVSKHDGNLKALGGVDLEVGQGQFFGPLGSATARARPR